MSSNSPQPDRIPPRPASHAAHEPAESPRDRAIVESLRRIIRAVDLHSRQLGEVHGLTAPQLAALQRIREAGSISQAALARAIHLSPATVTGILSRLEQRGLVERTVSDSDRRRIEVRTSAKGAEVLARAPSLLQDRFRNELAKLESWEQHLLLASLQRIAAMMDAEGLDASPHLHLGDIDSVAEANGRISDQGGPP